MTSHDAGIDTVLLDLDGTLVDSVYQHTAAWRAAFRDVGVDVASHRLHRSIGMGGDRLVTAVAGESVENAVGDEVRARHKEHLDERFHEIVATDGAVELLEELRTRGFTLVLASSADKELSERLLEVVEGAAPLLHDRVAGGDADESKPAPNLVEVALGSVSPDRAVMLGDTVWDVESAARAGVACLGLRTGGISTAELLEAGAASVHDTPRDLLEHLDETLLGRPQG
ncbi:HAD family hydrolase [Nocardioides salarius]|uniref:HAD family hydrolase n=1 Tax=Nocardioides salarius TaxID=374513 RepID=UPI0030F69FB9